MSDATLVLGRDGVWADEAEFQAWVAYVCEHIDAATGLNVDVDVRGMRDIQTDCVRGCDGDVGDGIREALNTIWIDFCADDSAWPKRDT